MAILKLFKWLEQSSRLLKCRYTKVNNCSKFCAYHRANKLQSIRMELSSWSMLYSLSSRLINSSSNLFSIYSSNQMGPSKLYMRLSRFKWHNNKPLQIKGLRSSKTRLVKDKIFNTSLFSRWTSQESWIRYSRNYTCKKDLRQNNKPFRLKTVAKNSLLLPCTHNKLNRTTWLPLGRRI